MKELHKESIANILLITFAVCLVCSVVVSSAAIGLRPLYEYNKQIDLQRSVLEVAGFDTEEKTLEELFKKIEIRILDLESGLFANIDPQQFDTQVALNEAVMFRALDKQEDIARIVTRPNYVKVYLIRDNGALDKVILPIHGYGLWSVLHGFIAIEEDGRTIYNIRFYDHAETPGLGGEVDNPDWRRSWRGKHLYDDQGKFKFVVLKGAVVRDSEDYSYQVDGLSGATLTSYGVSQMMRFWAGELGYQTFLNHIAARTIS